VKVSVRAHGGQAAALRAGRPPTVVDSTALPGDQAQELAALSAAALAEPSADVAPGRARDALSYTIEIDDGGRVVVLHGSDTSMPPAFAALLGWLQAHGFSSP
jgi:hypothetical protein